jgi:predicted nucleic acid-binding protein
MIVVTDTSPLNYLILIRADNILPALFGSVVAPPSVLDEMRHFRAPEQVAAWAENPPDWLMVQAPSPFKPFGRLDLGESDAIALAQQLRADKLLIDDRKAVKIAIELGLSCIGTLAVLELAAENNLIELSVAIAELRKTTCRLPEEVIADALDRDHERRQKR